MCNFEHFKKAKNLNKELKDQLKKKHCHFRAGFGGVSLISLNNNTPQLGVSMVSEPDKAFEKLEALPPKPGRETPEKKVQSSLIYDFLYGNPPEFWKDLGLTFLTAELRMKIPSGMKLKKGNTTSITNDILALDETGNLWIIELKSKRELSELRKQLKDFETVIWAQKGIVLELVRLMHPESKAWNGQECKKMIVWPVGASERTKQSIKDEQIALVIGYSPENPPFNYTVEVSI